ncbi:hypothetical protein, unknown function [Leishmania tarentolae]|uniref:Uncharacterized protein n=1 Tax=Leishmania tarentolae TaxID=5689 RepID=A0A640KWP5_LEITA|nr:hypothetical protein, unknown function [Leishmania tarentolae]
MIRRKMTSPQHKEVRVRVKSKPRSHKSLSVHSKSAAKSVRKAAATEQRPCATASVGEAADTRDAVSAVWNASAAKHGWESQHTKVHCEGGTAGKPFDRYDLAGTTNINELVLRHGTMKSSDLKTTRHPVLYQRVRGRHDRSSSPFMLDRYLSNLVRALVHPLHNYLQCHHSLHNADEVQVMLMPKDGPIALADRAVVSSRSPSPHGGSSALRRCYVSTNNETLTQESLQAAVTNWGVAGVFQIGEFVLVTGEKGRHAEQKLLEHLETKILSHMTPSVLPTADQRALIVGERLPCVACRLFAIAFESVAVLLPSHGHLYLSTIAAGVENDAAAESGKTKDINAMISSPAAAAALLLSPKHRRVLQ